MNLSKRLQVNQPNSFYLSILESIAEGIVVIGLDRRILFINKMVKKFSSME